MFAIHRTTIRDTYADDDRIHDLKVDQDHLNFITEVERFIEKNAPLPVTFDVSPCQNPYFSEFTYNDFGTGFWVKALSGEFNTRYFLDLPKDTKGEIIWKEKYELTEHVDESKDRTILFLAGTNLWNAHAWEIIDRVMYFEDKALIKTHPLTKDESLKLLGNRYGWHRILGPRDSGYGWYQKASQVYATANSELLVRSLLDGKLVDCITTIERLGTTSYMPFLMLHKKEYTGDQIQSVILSEDSGIVFRGQLDWRKRLQNYFDRVMEKRKEFQPYTPIYFGSITEE